MRNFFRVVIPRKIYDFLQLCGLILDKHTNDGATSKLNALDMTTFQALYTLAADADADGNAINRSKEEATQQRNLALGIDINQYSYTPNTVLYYISSIRDILMGIYKGSEQSLGKWGFDVNASSGNVSVMVPHKAAELITLGKLILDKHSTDPVTSPLASLDMTAFAALVNTAETNDNLSKQLTRDKEELFQKRNLAMGFAKGQTTSTSGTLLNLLTGVRDVLLGHYKGNEQALGAWGFDVNTSTNPTDPDTDPVVQTMVSGTVKNASTQQVIGNAAVIFNTSSGNITVFSNPLGNYEAVLNLSASENVLTVVTAGGYQATTETLSVLFEQNTVKDFNLMPI